MPDLEFQGISRFLFRLALWINRIEMRYKTTTITLLGIGAIVTSLIMLIPVILRALTNSATIKPDAFPPLLQQARNVERSGVGFFNQQTSSSASTRAIQPNHWGQYVGEYLYGVVTSFSNNLYVAIGVARDTMESLLPTSLNMSYLSPYQND